jgi:polar amino acid transport system permease protein
MTTKDLFDIEMVFKQIPDILKYLPVTMELAVIAMLFSLVLGLLIALVKMKKIPVLTQICNLFISVIRGTPIVVQLYVTYFGIPLFIKYLNLKNGTAYDVNGVPAVLYAFIALAINESAFNAEIIRGALQSVERGQIEAAHALGMTSFQTLKRIILPEAITVALPSLVNSFIGLIKGTSLAFTCAVVEMTAEAKILGGRNYRYFEAYVSLALIYWVITVVIEQIMKRVEMRLAIPDEVPEFQYKEDEEEQHDKNSGIIETIPEESSVGWD